MNAGQLVRVAVVIAGGVLLGVGTSPHPPGFARMFAHVWGIASLVMLALLVLLIANRAAEWVHDRRNGRKLAKRGR